MSIFGKVFAIKMRNLTNPALPFPYCESSTHKRDEIKDRSFAMDKDHPVVLD